ncbi:TPA: transposase [Klebsiella aerogenes]|nr:transposase [Klebsiella aerogenes]
MSNDNAYAESLFRMLKYVPQWPSSGFRALSEARQWVDKFTHWCNEEHRQSGIRYVPPGQPNRGEDNALLEQRDELYRMAQKAHPERWSGRTRNWQPEGPVTLNPGREKQAA